MSCLDSMVAAESFMDSEIREIFEKLQSQVDCVNDQLKTAKEYIQEQQKLCQLGRLPNTNCSQESSAVNNMPFVEQLCGMLLHFGGGQDDDACLCACANGNRYDACSARCVQDKPDQQVIMIGNTVVNYETAKCNKQVETRDQAAGPDPPAERKTKQKKVHRKPPRELGHGPLSVYLPGDIGAQDLMPFDFLPQDTDQS